MEGADPDAPLIDPVPASWYQRNKLQVKLLQFLIYHMRKEGITITPTAAAKPETPVLVRRLPGVLLKFD
jgi:hypothetical protein